MPNGGRWGPFMRAVTALGLGIAALVPLARPSAAAERIYISYSLFERSIAIADLERYAEQGILGGDLIAYSRYATPAELEKLQGVLTSQAVLNPVAVSNFLYTFQGEALLQRLSQVIQTESRQSSIYALRAAMILAAVDAEGLTLLNVLRHYPTNGIRINLDRSLQIAKELQLVVEENQQAFDVVNQRGTEEASGQPPFNLSGQSDLRKEGPFAWEERTITLTDRDRDRVFLADLYLPKRTQKAPIIAISHGLGSDRSSFRYLGRHLASHGFAVAIPEHPGSNAEQIQALLGGKANNVINPQEFFDRPLDIKLLLDEIERRARTDPSLQGRLAIDKVGVIGQSFGGYTALALAGAEIDFNYLSTHCEQLTQSWNLSLLLQCQARSLAASPLATSALPLRDERVKAAIAINPINSGILGPGSMARIQVPVMIVSGTADTVAPPLAEQIKPFTWLLSPNKYLVLMHAGTHFSTIGIDPAAPEGFPIPDTAIGPDPVLAQSYVKSLSVALMETFLSGQPQYQRYLTANYAKAIDKSPIQLTLIQSLTEAQLSGFLAQEKR